MTAATTALSYDDMIDLLRRNGFGPLGIPVCGGAAIDPALARSEHGTVTMLVAPTYGSATVTRVECANDKTNPSWFVRSVLVNFVAPKEEAALWLLEDYGLIPDNGDEEQQP